MQLSGGIFNRNLLAYQDDISKTIGNEFNCFELQHIKAYKNDAIGLYTANNGDNTVSPNDILHDSESGLVICGEIRLYNREYLLNLLDDNKKLQTQNNHQLVLALFKKYSYQCVKHLNGDFAFVIWDENKQEMFCARDQMGQRPFYYCLEKEQFIFSTHLNGICMHQNLSKELDEIWVLDYLQKKYRIPIKLFIKP